MDKMKKIYFNKNEGYLTPRNGNDVSYVSYAQFIDFKQSQTNIIAQLEADKLEMAKAVEDKAIQDDGDWGECIYCHEGGWGFPEKHKDDCPVSKAKKLIEDNKGEY